ncbi:hypothetical protein D9613_007134 [Agrocybe pediades]|uniref:HNH nuclease domain-containing protein n=1 Tax=Agrocybe pediades TaxID=84607 RepID=A0A8H4VI05_9AGAR|nr:hypothetical protein D9613_007134 [Agrocybe pediades]
MSRNQYDSLASMASTLTSCSSDASVQFYKERLKTSMAPIQESQIPLQDLVHVAEKIINETFAPDSRSTYRIKKGSDADEISVRLDQLMVAMLACVEECGGEKGKRYVASAIVACSQEEDVVGALEALGTTWLTHFLFISNVVVAHILRRAVGEFNANHESKSFKSAVTTFDILVNFTHLPVKTLEELHDQLDDPSNGMALEMNAHAAFDDFLWCLKRTETEHVYDLKTLHPHAPLLKKPENNQVSFTDHSNQFPLDNAHTKYRSVDLPDPRYIAIHSAIAEILHMSGAGNFFDDLLDDYRDDEDNVPAVRSWSELEALMGNLLLRESIIDGFQPANRMESW